MKQQNISSRLRTLKSESAKLAIFLKKSVETTNVITRKYLIT